MKTRGKEDRKDGKTDVKGNDPKTRKFSRREVLKTGIVALGGLAVSRCNDEYRANGDGGTSDASGLDANVTLDASLLDGSTSLDASMNDANVLDGSVTPDAMVLDGSVNDASTQQDAAVSSCVATEAPEHSHLLNDTTPNTAIVGDYNVTWASITADHQEITIHVNCIADNTPIATGATVQQGQATIIPLDGTMQLTVGFVVGNDHWAHITTQISQSP